MMALARTSSAPQTRCRPRSGTALYPRTPEVPLQLDDRAPIALAACVVGQSAVLAEHPLALTVDGRSNDQVRVLADDRGQLALNGFKLLLVICGAEVTIFRIFTWSYGVAD